MRKKKKICEICGKKMRWWQDVIMTTDEFGYVVVPILHSKCSDKQGSKPYTPKG